MTRLVSAVGFLFVATAAPAAEPPEPTITIQAKPGGQLVDEVRAFIRSFAGNEAVKDFEHWMKESLGEKGFTGVDMLRPPVAAVYLAPKLEESWGVVVIPITGQKEFLELLRDRLQIELAEQKDAEGVYAVSRLGPGLEADGVPIQLRLHKGNAHVSINGKPGALDSANLIVPASIADPAEQSPLAAHLHLARLDPALRKRALVGLEESIKELEGGPQVIAPVWSAVIGLPILKVTHRAAGQVASEAECLTFRVRTSELGRKELSYEFVVKPKPGTKLAADIAAWKPTPHRFAGILPEDAVAGGVLRLPLFAPELRESAGKLVDLMTKEAGAGEAAKVAAALEKGALRTIRGSEIDLGVALTGPDKKGVYTVVAAVSFDDPSGVEKSLREAAKALPEAIRETIKFDAARAGGLTVHTGAVGPFLPDEVKPILGDQATAAVAFGPKAIYAAIGPDAVKELGRVIALKPGEARMMDLRMNPKKFKRIAADSGNPFAHAIADALGDEDRLATVNFLDLAGGRELVLRWGASLYNLPTSPFGR